MAFWQRQRNPYGLPEGQPIPPEVVREQLTAPGPSTMPLVGALRTGPEQPTQRIGVDQIKEAAEILQKYKQGKASLESRIVEDELWWELRHWEVIGRSERARRMCPCDANGRPIPQPEPTSAWLFNSIANKHADAMDNYPEPVVLPREQSDEQSARTLSSVLPVVLEQNDFEATYADAWWEKLKHGTAAYGVFWNSEKENGLGDIDIVGIDLLNLFWEPGITDIQDSRNLFVTELVDRDILEAQYPKQQLGSTVDIQQYIYDDSVDTSDKLTVVDWYYKLKGPDGLDRVHYVKFCGDCLMYASENEPEYAERGYYDHGLYPVVLDVLFPEKGTPAGFGYVAVCKDPQLYIDKLSAGILENAMMQSKKRYFVSSSTGINVDEFLDWNKPLVRVEGELGDERIQEIPVTAMGSLPIDVMQLKIDEMKETAANRDVSSGGTSGGVTAASAISALQEAGNKVSRDMIAASYRSYAQIARQVIELMRQFYQEMRAFRVTMPNGDYQFMQFDNSGLQDQVVGTGIDGQELIRRPFFDLKIKAQKSNPFARIEQNSRAQELYGAGFFAPENAQASLIALDMMDFEGIDRVREQVRQGQTLLNLLQQCQQQLAMMQQAAGMMPQGQAQQHPQQSGGGGGQSVDSRRAAGAVRAQRDRTPMQDRMARAASPHMGGER